MSRRQPLLVATVALATAGMVASGSASAPGGCTAAHLTGSFALLAGSQGAGSVSYALRLKNVGGTGCTISGRPGLRLLDAKGRPLPTHTVPDQRGTGTAALVTVRPGHHAVATGRFSPDIPSSGEGTPCEPTAYSVRITLPSPAHGTITGPVKPPTSVCGKGRIVLGLLHG